MQRLSVCLWFDQNAEEAVGFYTGIFKNSKTGRVSHYGEAGRETHGRPAGSVMTIEFELNGQPFMALNGGPHFKFNEAISVQIPCETQEEVDYYWSKLAEGGDPRSQQCGWLKDKFGLSWQVVPTLVNDCFANPGNGNIEAMMNALLKMKKLDIAGLKRAYEQR